MAKTLHVYPSDGVWVVKREGQRASTFGTRREAFAIAVRRGKKAKSAQVVVHGKDGQILEYRNYGMPKIQEPLGKGRLADKKIATAVGRVVLDRLHTDRAHTPEK